VSGISTIEGDAGYKNGLFRKAKMKRFQYLHNPPTDMLGNSAEEFLQKLTRPSCIVLDGEDNTRSRAIVTLLHGNEPSGVKALFRWLKSQRRPAVTTVCLIASVQAALEEPMFSYRVLPGQRDLNRCFRAPFQDSQGELAAEILEILNEHQPEAVVDVHNTSGSGPSFGVAISIDKKHEALISLFTNRLVTNDLRLGAIMEIAEHLFPTVTIECGGRLDDDAHELAWDGLQRFMTTSDILTPQAADWGLEVFRNPVRLELDDGCRLTYADNPQAGYDLTLKTDIEHYNFGLVKEATLLGWVGEKGLSIFSSQNLQQECVLSELLTLRDGGLYTAQDLKLFMITNNPSIARMDCLFYAVKDSGTGVFEF
jgi:Succinylglutamate desuccinylase / Aspartoacylase family